MTQIGRIDCQIKDYIQPFERLLALQELRSLASGPVVPIDGDEATAKKFAILTENSSDILRRSLAYWHSVGDGSKGLTSQILGEATSIIARNGIAIDSLVPTVPGLAASKLPNKRCLRYATHGLHEYRGKFFPQLVRALINIAAVPEDGIILDPMSGSGTTLVEAKLLGRASFGFDLNPLSVFIANVKCQSLSIAANELVSGYVSIADALRRPQYSKSKLAYLNSLPDRDQDYLGKWFALKTLQELDAIQHSLNKLSPKIRNFFLVCLSNILRVVSWQKEADLRVRKEVSVHSEGDVLKKFLDEALRSTKIVAAYLAGRTGLSLGAHSVVEGDARRVGNAVPSIIGKVDAIITSPPYATALPYLDTDRLSLIYLGLLPREDHRARDTLMIGNREISEKTRLKYWSDYNANQASLPKGTRQLIEKVDRLNKTVETGFRRRNLSALLAKYFFDMREVIDQQKSLLRLEGKLFMVVGNNRTVAGGEEVEIETARHLGEIAEELGFRIAANQSMQMLVSRDIFRKNAMPSEQIVTLEKVQ